MRSPRGSRQFETHAIPSSDEAFARVVRSMTDSADSPSELMRRLRPLYPSVRLSESELDGQPTVYYVYRDGAFLGEPDDAWWTDPSAAFVELSADTGRLTRINGSWEHLTGATGDLGLAGPHYSDFVQPEARESAEALFASILALEEIRTRLLMRSPTGDLFAVEVRAVRDGDVIRVHYRGSGEGPGEGPG